MSNVLAVQEQSGRPSALFRAPATARTARLEGAVILSQPAPFSLLVWAGCAIMTALIVFLSVGTYSKRQTAIGYVAPASGFISVTPQSAGVVRGLSIKEGQLVHQGQTVFWIVQQRSTFEGDSNASMEKMLRSSVEATQTRADTENDLSRLRFAALDSQIQDAEGRIRTLQTQLKYARERVRIAETQHQNLVALSKDGLVAKNAVAQQRMTLLDTESALMSLRSDLSNAEANSRSLRLQRDQEHSQLLVRLSDIEQKPSELGQRLVQSQANAVEVVRAPVAGRVSGIRTHDGQAINGQQPAFSIIPVDENYLVELYVPTVAIASLRVGQQVHLKYKAYPFEKFGTQTGQVTEISSIPFTRDQLPVPLGIAEQPVYRLRVELLAVDRGSGLSAPQHASRFQLVPGMLVDADVVLERRSLWEWLSAPMRRAVGELTQ